MIVQGQCSVFKLNLLNGLEDFTAPTPYTYKIALYTATANLDYNTLAYTTAGEVSAAGYTAGGQVLTIIPPAVSGQTAYLSFNNVTWSGATITARGALIYNATTNAAVAVINFGNDITQTNFTVTFPTNGPTTSILRIS